MRLIALALLNILLLPLYGAFLLLAVLLVLVPIFPTRNGLQNLHERVGVSRIRARVILIGVYCQYAFTGVEMALFWPLGLMHVTNRHEFEDFMRKIWQKYGSDQRGVALLMGHHGHIEEMGNAMARALKVCGFPGQLHALAKPAAMRIGTLIMGWYRSRRSIGVLWTDRRDLLRAMLQVAKSGGSLIFVADQKPESGGVFTEFFGKHAAFPYRGPGAVISTGLPFVHGTAMRLWPGCFRILYGEGANHHIAAYSEQSPISGNCDAQPSSVWTQGMDNREQQMAPVIAAFSGWMEAAIRQSLTQWCWDYRKWSRAPGNNTHRPATQPVAKIEST